jgi:hypothetical protein
VSTGVIDVSGGVIDVSGGMIDVSGGVIALSLQENSVRRIATYNRKIDVFFILIIILLKIYLIRN